MRTKGKIVSWNDEKGFGFITPGDGGKEVFLHVKSFSDRNRRPELNQSVTYTLSTDKQGRSCAVKAVLSGKQLPQKRKRSASVSIIGAVLFFITIGISVHLFKISPLVFIFYLVVSLFTYIIYAVDKSAAKSGAWRMSEKTLHFFSLIGGWPGAMIAQQQLRHKSIKQPFRAIYWITVLLNLSAFIWFFTPIGTSKLHPLFSFDDISKISSSLPELKTPDFLINANDTLKSLFESKIFDRNVRVYKWQDEKGIWHYSEDAPKLNEQASEVSTIQVNTDANIIRE
ncbi:MAG: DUF1294 domain-containing protein [Gammaproteobacteria bacterium]|nr:DUF1294 domain-containing protein [Gammaproteobacteria bacterium]